MFAVVKTGGKQLRVATGDIIEVEKLPGEAGDTVVLDNVLLLNDGKTTKIGTPGIAGASVTATILEQKRADKIIVFKKQRRKGYRRTMGHRQQLTVLKISGLGGTKKATPKKDTTVKSKGEKAKTKKTALKKTTAKAKPAAKKTPAKKPTKS